MFSGIVEEIGHITLFDMQAGKLILTVCADLCIKDLRIGDSIAVNGVCLTVIKFDANSFTVEVIPETLRLTNLGNLGVNEIVNLERALKVSDRIGGHLVQGHVDGIATIHKIESDGDSLKIWFTKPNQWSDCLIPKGYITIDGMSLTLVDVISNYFSICFIPHTQNETIVKQYKVGTFVNLEIDHITKTIATIVNRVKGDLAYA